jgi:hypothetical protein
MTFIPVAWKPQTALSKDVKVGLQMTPLPLPVEQEAATGVPPACRPLWAGWRVTWDLPAPDVPFALEVTSDGNVDDPIPYPDGCWSYVVILIGLICEGDCLEWVADFRDSDGEQIVADPITGAGIAASLLQTGSIDFDPCIGVALSISSSQGAWIDGRTIDSTLTLTAFLRGEQFGPPISFACNPTLYPIVWNHWLPRLIDFTAHTNVVDTDQSYEEFYDVTKTRTFGFINNEWWTNTSRLTFVITQDAGPPVPDLALYFGVAPWDCNNWSLFFQTGYSYAGTAFIIQPQLDGVDFGDSLYYFCQV